MPSLDRRSAARRVGAAAHLAVVLAMGLAASQAQAGTLLYDISAGDGGLTSTSVGNIGFDFTLSTSISIGSLGLWDEGGDGLAGPHQVGVFSLAGVLQVSATVDNSSTAVASTAAGGRWLFTDLATPFSLAPGTWTLGYFNPSSGNDPFRYEATGDFMAGSAWLTSRFDGVSTFARPSGQGDRTQAYFGPNLMTVPVPRAAWSGLALLAGLAVTARRRRARTVR